MKSGDTIRMLGNLLDVKGHIRIADGEIGKVIAVYPADDTAYVVLFKDDTRETVFENEIGKLFEVLE